MKKILKLFCAALFLTSYVMSMNTGMEIDPNDPANDENQQTRSCSTFRNDKLFSREIKK